MKFDMILVNRFMKI